MPEINEECIFEINSDNVRLNTSKGSTVVTINGSGMTQTQLTILAWLINNGPVMEIEIKHKV